MIIGGIKLAGRKKWSGRILESQYRLSGFKLAVPCTCCVTLSNFLNLSGQQTNNLQLSRFLQSQYLFSDLSHTMVPSPEFDICFGSFCM